MQLIGNTSSWVWGMCVFIRNYLPIINLSWTASGAATSTQSQAPGTPSVENAATLTISNIFIRVHRLY